MGAFWIFYSVSFFDRWRLFEDPPGNARASKKFLIPIEMAIYYYFILRFARGSSPECPAGDGGAWKPGVAEIEMVIFIFISRGFCQSLAERSRPVWAGLGERPIRNINGPFFVFFLGFWSFPRRSSMEILPELGGPVRKA